MIKEKIKGKQIYPKKKNRKKNTARKKATIYHTWHSSCVDKCIVGLMMYIFEGSE